MKNKLTLILAVAGVFFGVLALFKTPVNTVVEKYMPDLAGVSNIISSPRFTFGDVESHNKGIDSRTATSTLCVIESPSATSTLEKFVFLPKTATSSTVTLVLEDMNRAYAPDLSAATSTFVYATLNEPSGGTWPLVFATSTVSGVQTANTLSTIGPNRYVVLYGKFGGGGTILSNNSGTGSVFASGRCTARFTVVGR